MIRTGMRKVVVGLGAGLLVSSAAMSARADTDASTKKLRIATPAACDSVWGRILKTFQKGLEKKTTPDGAKAARLSIDLYCGGSQGNELDMVGRITSGQLEGAALTATGLGKIDKQILVLQSPGVIKHWGAMDRIRGLLKPKFDALLDNPSGTPNAKFKMLAWADVGRSRFFSKGFAVHQPSDLAGKLAWVYPGEPILPTVYNNIPGVAQVTSELFGVGTKIDGGQINCLSAPALVNDMMQWGSKWTHAVDAVNSHVVGGLVISAAAYNSLPGDLQKILDEASESLSNHHAGLKHRIRAEDDAAWDRFRKRQGVTIYTPTPEDTEKWQAVFRKSRQDLRGKGFRGDLLDAVEAGGK